MSCILAGNQGPKKKMGCLDWLDKFKTVIGVAADYTN